MTLHSVIGILVAVAVPLWLVVEQVLKWRVLEPRRSIVLGPDGDEPPVEGGIPDRRRDVTGPALHRKAS
jgi:hypothetical protein